MLFRRIDQHVRDQNWFAVAIDFAIVVIGVFIGIQLGNWNSDQEDAREYDLAQDRLVSEIQANLTILDDTDAQLSRRLSEASAAFDLLQSCATDTLENRQIISTGLRAISGTLGITLRTSALRQLNEDPRLLAQQSEVERADHSELLYRIELLQTEAKYAENLPLESRVADNPIIAIGSPESLELSILGDGQRRDIKALLLSVPLSAACQNDRLIKSFYHWERWQSQQLALSGLMRARLEEALTEDSADL